MQGLSGEQAVDAIASDDHWTTIRGWLYAQFGHATPYFSGVLIIVPGNCLSCAGNPCYPLRKSDLRALYSRDCQHN